MNPQLGFFDTQVRVPPPPRPSIEERFAGFLRDHPWFMDRLLREAHVLQSAGVGRISVKRLFEELRVEVEGRGDTWALNNDFTALAGRRLIEMDHGLNRLIEVRKRRAS